MKIGYQTLNRVYYTFHAEMSGPFGDFKKKDSLKFLGDQYFFSISYL